MGFLAKIFGFKGFTGRFTISPQTIEKIRSDWENIEVLLESKGPSQLRQALIIADKSLDNALKDLVLGDTMGERLKAAKDKFEYKTYDRLWKAHKVRNALVHEAGYEPPYFVVTGAVKNLKKGLTSLGIDL